MKKSVTSMAKGKAVKVVGYARKKPVDVVCERAEALGIYNVESMKRGVAYMYADDEIAIVTNRGHLIMSVDTAKCMIEELTGLIEDIKDMRRMQCRK